MNIEQVKCDHCGKVHDTPGRSSFLSRTELLSVPLKVGVKTQYLDFCGEDCLRAELIKRKDASTPNDPSSATRPTRRSE